MMGLELSEDILKKKWSARQKELIKEKQLLEEMEAKLKMRESILLSKQQKTHSQLDFISERNSVTSQSEMAKSLNIIAKSKTTRKKLGV